MRGRFGTARNFFIQDGSFFHSGLNCHRGCSVNSCAPRFHFLARSFLRRDLIFSRSLFAQNDFALADELVVQPQAVLICGRFASGARRAAKQPHAGGRLKNVGRKRTAVHIEFDAQIARVGDPGYLVAFINHDDLRDESNEYGTFSHFSVWPRCNSGADAPNLMSAQGR
jgi:hypothetical protein